MTTYVARWLNASGWVVESVRGQYGSHRQVIAVCSSRSMAQRIARALNAAKT